MSLTYNLDEAFEIAEQIEENGAVFYRKAAEIHSDGIANELFLKLAGEEDKHQTTFHKLREQLVDQSTGIATYDRDETVTGYLKALAGSYVFNPEIGPEEELAGSSSVPDILKMAMSKERDSITLYLGIRQVMNESDGEKVSKILQEEQRHLVDLIATLAQFDAENRKE